MVSVTKLPHAITIFMRTPPVFCLSITFFLVVGGHSPFADAPPTRQRKMVFIGRA